MISPAQIQRDAMKLVEGGIASTIITVQAFFVTAAVWIYW